MHDAAPTISEHGRYFPLSIGEDLMLRKTHSTSNSGPFIAWSYSQELMTPSVAFRQSCEKHLRKTIAEISSGVGIPDVEGIIICDRYERGFAVAALLDEQDKTLPTEAQGATCDEHFADDDLCDRTNDFAVLGRMHEGARGMLITLPRDESRRLMLLDQRQVSLLHPMAKYAGRDKLAVIGLLAHEMAHARDYAAGRPGRPSVTELAHKCRSEHVDALAVISDMAVAEYIATRAECATQVSLQGACSSALTGRIEVMSRKDLEIPPLCESDLSAGHDPEQRRYDLAHVGNVLGTLAAYAAAEAPVMGKDGALEPHRTSEQVTRSVSGRPRIRTCLAMLTPALEAAASAPSAATRGRLAKAMEGALVAARSTEMGHASFRKKAPRDACRDSF